MASLYQLFNEHYALTLTEQHVLGLQKFMFGFETRGVNPQALGTPLIGVHKAHFLADSDDVQLFNLFGINFTEFKTIAHSADGINPNFTVSSDPYNLLTMWLVHLFYNSTLATNKKTTAMLALLKLMQYRIFTSVVHHNLKQGANEGIMQYTVDNNLNNKFDIKVYGTWKSVIEHHAEDFLEGIHKETIRKFSPDNKVTYAISDIRTRLQKQIVRISKLYYDNHKAGNITVSLNAIEDINGDLSIRVVESFMDTMVNGVVNCVTNVNEFIDHDYVEMAVHFSNDVTEDLFIRLLHKFSALAEYQLKHGEQDLVKGTKNAPIYDGYRVLITTFLQKTYRMCIHDKVNMASKVAILKRVRDAYRSSRISDPDVLAVKDSIDVFVNKHSNSRRPATNASLRICLVIYLILLSYRYFN